MPRFENPLTQHIFEAAQESCGGRFETEGEFFETFTEKVVPRIDERESGVIGRAIAEIVNASGWPWEAT